MICQNGYGQQFTLIRGDDTGFRFEFEAGALVDVESATFTLERHRAEPIHIPGVIDGDVIEVDIGAEHTQVAGQYRADLQLVWPDGTVQTPWLAGRLGDIRIVDDVTKVES